MLRVRCFRNAAVSVCRFVTRIRINRVARNEKRAARTPPRRPGCKQNFDGTAPRSVPIAFEKAPHACFLLPAGRNPVRAHARWECPVTRHPLILVIAPGPVSSNPDMIRRGARRRHLLLRRGWRLHHHNRAAAHRSGRRDGCPLRSGLRWNGVNRGGRSRRRRRGRRGCDEDRGGLGCATSEHANCTTDRE